MTKKQKILCLMGPTASGKTAAALAIAAEFPITVISVDSAMVYKGMDIGTAKPSLEEQACAPHRLIDIRDPTETYSAADFCADTEYEIADVYAQDRIPLLVGGTMLYFQALQQGLSPLPKADAELRASLLAQAEVEGWEALHQRLREIDPIAAARIHPNDPQRIQRALEVYYLTGQPLTNLQEIKPELPEYEFVNFALMPERSVLHKRIAERFDAMLQQGFIEEVAQLYARKDLHPELPSLRSVGYRQAWDYLAGKIDAAAFRELSIIATRQLAKRQSTWLRAWPAVTWLDLESSSNSNDALAPILEYMRILL